ncbi:pentapeptide repeat-containing protein [Anabaena cylindrica UHCC 0172]|uniref:pentapeptide repeat-containing protein n=1 Tax=Anabaena cylindrica TaxID=1165 RepID=UPI002B20E5A9|nr:pentapeptide repeat-containing protein [Anabaena cylindrica]MEA5553809.1 pentapeptide repeat-containing protein [Anabaena cylindrica UHCC 0172]
MKQQDKDNNIGTLGNWLLAIAVIFLLFVGGIFLGVLNIETWTLKEKYDYGTKALTSIGTVFGGIAVFINAFFAAKRAAAMEESAKAANKNVEIARENLKISEDKQITERFAKAIEQLASDKIEVRLGAIYTLERIAKDSKKDQWTIMEVLTAFVRENALIKEEVEELPKLRLDIQECLTVIGRREHPDPPDKRLNLSNVNISKANLTGANLKRAILGGVNFKKAILVGANLEEAILTRANLTEAFLTGANLKKVILLEAKLIGTILAGVDLTKAHLEEAILKEAVLERAIMPDGSIHD